MPTRLEVVEVLLRVATVYREMAKTPEQFMIAMTSRLGACAALYEMTVEGIITKEEGCALVECAIEAVTNPFKGYNQAKFNADEEFLNDHIGLLTLEPTPVEINETITSLEKSYISR